MRRIVQLWVSKFRARLVVLLQGVVAVLYVLVVVVFGIVLGCEW